MARASDACDILGFGHVLTDVIVNVPDEATLYDIMEQLEDEYIQSVIGTDKEGTGYEALVDRTAKTVKHDVRSANLFDNVKAKLMTMSDLNRSCPGGSTQNVLRTMAWMLKQSKRGMGWTVEMVGRIGTDQENDVNPRAQMMRAKMADAGIVQHYAQGSDDTGVSVLISNDDLSKRATRFFNLGASGKVCEMSDLITPAVTQSLTEARIAVVSSHYLKSRPDVCKHVAEIFLTRRRKTLDAWFENDGAAQNIPIPATPCLALSLNTSRRAMQLGSFHQTTDESGAAVCDEAANAATLNASLVITPQGADVHTRMWQAVRILAGNEAEMVALAQACADTNALREAHGEIAVNVDPNASIEDIARTFSHYGSFQNELQKRFVIVTRHAQGAMCVVGDNTFTFQPETQVDIVDTTGCGDAFLGGFLAKFATYMETPGWNETGSVPHGVVEFHGTYVNVVECLKAGTAAAQAVMMVRGCRFNDMMGCSDPVMKGQ